MMNDDTAARYQNADQALEALSKLPVSPIWSVDVSSSLIRWEHKNKTRRIIVEWKRHSPRKQEWIAWSEPLNKGRKKTLNGSRGIIGRAQAVAELERYFEN